MEYIINKVTKDEGNVIVQVDIVMPEEYFDETISLGRLGVLKTITEEISTIDIPE